MARTTTAPTGQIAPLGLRMLPQMRERIEQAARESGRSLNAEIVHRLAQTLGEDFAAEQPALALMREQTGYLRELRDMARAQAEQSRQSALTALD
ncbi:Arc family DNA-binding protein [Delftia deserti]|uniref:Arc family DNA-binding protein n=1 Tax=Delftia deserti TaxID=1651218 RepID=A0ABW5EKG2_9BURK